MDHADFHIWLIGIGIFMAVGLVWSIINLNNSYYYMDQAYNNLPFLESKPEPIKHYEQIRDEVSFEQDDNASVIKTNQQNLNQSLLYPFYNEDGSINPLAVGIFVFVYWFFIVKRHRSLF